MISSPLSIITIITMADLERLIPKDWGLFLSSSFSSDFMDTQGLWDGVISLMNEAAEMHAKIVFMLVVKNPVILIPGAKASLVCHPCCVLSSLLCHHRTAHRHLNSNCPERPNSHTQQNCCCLKGPNPHLCHRRYCSALDSGLIA